LFRCPCSFYLLLSLYLCNFDSLHTQLAICFFADRINAVSFDKYWKQSHW
jgi:hypothetical protein